ncbi:hypothetical protein [Williamsia sp. CHRR-6]|uniref:hypothetical protein n=1 Tax=Williamsia sp. CHRR-6 TaxID=2835871 RepID=UPI001BDB61EA|nr:hypothetical protein [Williamsia sp. CHRR-6]MBT0566783.1 hypothetical protein [Williamsia sp. CHRR-6]
MYGEQYDIRPLTDPTKPNGPGEADQVFLLTPKNGGPSKTVLVEAKGVNADLGSKIVNGERVQQGTREYVEDLSNSDREDQEVRDALQMGLDDGSLKYLLIRPTVDSSGRWTGSVAQQFNIDK